MGLVPPFGLPIMKAVLLGTNLDGVAAVAQYFEIPVLEALVATLIEVLEKGACEPSPVGRVDV